VKFIFIIVCYTKDYLSNDQQGQLARRYLRFYFICKIPDVVQKHFLLANCLFGTSYTQGRINSIIVPLPWAKQFCSNPAHDEVYLKQHYVIKFVSELRQVDVFFSGKPVFSTNKTDRHDITEIFLKVVLKTITLTLLLKCLYSICVRGIDLPISTIFFYQILELFWQCDIFCFSFFLITIYILSIPKNNNHIYLLYHELHFNC
jgi:hypothetical protein